MNVLFQSAKFNLTVIRTPSRVADVIPLWRDINIFCSCICAVNDTRCGFPAAPSADNANAL